MAAPQLKINGTDRFNLLSPRSLNAKRSLVQTSVLDFVIEDQAGDSEPLVGHEVKLLDEDGNNLMGGIIADTQQTDPSADDSHVRYRVNPSSNRKLADKRIFNEKWASTDVKTIVEDIVDSVLTEESITKGTIDGSDESIDIFRASYKHISDVLDDLAGRVGFIWRINTDRSLDFIDFGSDLAPWDLNDSALQDRVQRLTPIQRDIEYGEYRNRQFVRGVQGILKSRTQVFTAEEGQGSFELKFPIEELESITVNGTDETETRVTTHPYVPGLPSGLSNNKWNYHPGGRQVRTFAGFQLSEGDTVRITYRGRGKATIAVEDTDEINNRASVETGSGVHSAVYDGTFEDVEAAKQFAKGKLETHAKIPTKFQYDTFRKDIAIGQVQAVNLTDFNAEGEFIITDIEFIGRGLNEDIDTDRGRLKRRVTISDKKPAALIFNKRDSDLNQESRDEEQTIIPSDASSSLKAEAGSDKDDTESDTDSELDNDQVEGSGVSSDPLWWGTSTETGDLIGHSPDANLSRQRTISGSFTSGGGIGNIDGDHVAIIDQDNNNIEIVDLVTEELEHTESTGKTLSGIATGSGGNTVWIMGSGTDIHEFTFSYDSNTDTWTVSFSQTYTGDYRASEAGITFQGSQRYLHSNGSPDDFWIRKADSSWSCSDGDAIMSRTNGHGTVLLADNGNAYYRRDSDPDSIVEVGQGNFASCGSNDPFTNTGGTHWQDNSFRDFIAIPEKCQDFELV